MDMKRTQKETKALNEVSDIDQEEYPWGLRLRLEGPELDKLGADFPQVGTEVKFMATAKVVSTQKSESENDNHRSVELQVVDMELNQAGPDAKDVLYGKDEK